MSSRPIVPALELRILGPLEIVVDGEPVDIAAPKLRSLLCDFVVRSGQVISTDQLIDDLWGEDPPRTAVGTLRSYVTKLRGLLGPTGADVLRASPPGYVLDVEIDAVDARRFERSVQEVRARGMGPTPEAVASLRTAIDLWRGPALADVTYEPWAQPEIARLEELRWSAVEELAQLELDRGRHDEVIADLESHAASQPRRERLRELLMIALYRSGRQTDALRCAEEFRRQLRDELGLEPSVSIRELEQSILLQSPELDVRSVVRATAAHNLPTSLTSFIGRDQELEEVAELLASSRLVTLLGPGGCGKSRLAVEVGRRAPGPNGVWIAELASIQDGTHVPHAVAGALGVVEEPGRSLTETIAGFVAGQSITLIIDNCEHVVPACAELAERLLSACPGLRVLATSREPLGIDGEITFRVPPLPINDAVRLFMERAQQALPGSRFATEERHVSEIVRRLDGIPLALELAAPLVRSLRLEDIAHALDRRFELLTAGRRTALPRHRTLRALVDWSYELLSDRERSVFDALSVFAGAIRLDAARAVVGGDRVVESLSRLVDKSLLTAEHGAESTRFTLLETLRQYAHEKLSEDPANLALRVDRHLDWYVEWAEEAAERFRGERAGRWLDEVEADLDNIRAAMRRGISSSAPMKSLRIAVALGHFWILRGFRQEGRSWLLRSMDSETPDDLRALALVARSDLAFNLGDRATALREAKEAVEHGRSCGVDRVIGECLLQLGKLTRVHGDQGGASRYYSEAHDLGVSCGLADTTGSALAGLGDLAAAEGDLGRARSLYEQALTFFADSGHPHAIGSAWLNLAAVATREGRTDDASTLFHEALTIYESLRDRPCSAEALFGLAVLSQHDAITRSDADGLTRAEGLHRRALRWRADIGQRAALVDSFEAVATLAGARGEPVRAARLLGAAEALREQTFSGVPLSLRKAHAASIETATAGADATELADAWQEGRKMTLDEAVDYALEAGRVGR